jgi:hypothetical protein
MCAACGCGKKKGEPGFGKGPKSKSKKACTCGTCKSCKGKKMSPKQKKLDVDKDGKLEGSDFAALRKKKKK